MAPVLGKHLSHHAKACIMHHFDADEFLVLLVKYHDGHASRKEISYIKRQLSRLDKARELWNDVQETFADEGNTSKARHPSGITGRWVIAAAVVFLIILTDIAYLLFRPTRQGDLRPRQVLMELADGRTIKLKGAITGLIDTCSGLPRLDAFLPLTKTGYPPAASHSLSVPRGLAYATRLPDETAVYLNSDTRLRLPGSFLSGKREVFLEGEAYFIVAHQAHRPFIVHTRNADIITAASSLNVCAYDNTLSASLLKGCGMVMNTSTMVQLGPGEAAVLQSNHETLEVKRFDNCDVPDWTLGRYLFSKKSLEEVCRIAGRLYDADIVIDRDEIATYHYTGAINRKAPLRHFLEQLGSINKIAHYYDGKGRLHLR
jgi:hypothetical protein